MKRFLTWTFWIVAVLLLLFFGTIVIGTQYAKRVAPWPDPVPGISLTPARPFLAASNIGPDNAYFYFLQLTNHGAALNWGDALEEDIIRFRTNGWCAGAYSRLEAWVETNRSLLGLYVNASKAINSQSPSLSHEDRSFQPPPFSLLLMNNLYAFEIARSWNEGQRADAVSHTEILLACAAHLEKGQGIMGRNLAHHGDEQAYLQTIHAAQAGLMDRQSNERVAELVHRRDSSREPFAEALKHEAAVTEALYEKIYSSPISETLLEREWLNMLQPFLPLVGSTATRSQKNTETHFSLLVWAYDDMQNVKEARKVLDRFHDHSSIWPLLFDDPIGRFCVWILASSYMNWPREWFRSVALNHSTIGVLAVERWRIDHGDAPPAAVVDLVPKYLAKVPEDPFAKGSNLLYRVDGESYVVYSVGVNGADNRGDVEGPNASDVGWRVVLDRKAGAKQAE